MVRSHGELLPEGDGARVTCSCYQKRLWVTRQHGDPAIKGDEPVLQGRCVEVQESALIHLEPED